MAKLTTELARLEEDNGRQKWMIGEKDKQIKEVQGKYAASAAYALQEKLQESMEALEVMANLQAEQLQYMEDHALRKLDAQDTQIADVQDDLDTKRAHLTQLKTLMAGYWETGDDSLVPPMLSLAGFKKTEALQIASHRERLADAGIGGLVRGLGRRGYGFYEKFSSRAPTGSRLTRSTGVPRVPRVAPRWCRREPGAVHRAAHRGEDGQRRIRRRTDTTTTLNGFDAAKQTNPFATSETVPESAAPTPEKGSDGEPDDAPVAARGERGAPIGTQLGTQLGTNSAPNSAAKRRSPNQNQTAPSTGGRPAERAAREAEKSARRESQRRSPLTRRPPRVRPRSRDASPGRRTAGRSLWFDDEEHRDKERREGQGPGTAAAPKLKGRAAEAEARRRRRREARWATGDGFAGFGSDETNDSDSD